MKSIIWATIKSIVVLCIWYEVMLCRTSLLIVLAWKRVDRGYTFSTILACHWWTYWKGQITLITCLYMFNFKIFSDETLFYAHCYVENVRAIVGVLPSKRYNQHWGHRCFSSFFLRFSNTHFILFYAILKSLYCEIHY